MVDAWEARCSERKAAGLAPLPKPVLMHSNLDDVDHVIRMCRCRGVGVNVSLYLDCKIGMMHSNLDDQRCEHVQVLGSQPLHAQASRCARAQSGCEWMRVSLNQTPSRAVCVWHSLFRFDHMQAHLFLCWSSKSRLPNTTSAVPQAAGPDTAVDLRLWNSGGWLSAVQTAGRQRGEHRLDQCRHEGGGLLRWISHVPQQSFMLGCTGLCTRHCRPASPLVFLQVR